MRCNQWRKWKDKADLATGYEWEHGECEQVNVGTQGLESEREHEKTGYKSAEAAGVLKTSPGMLTHCFKETLLRQQWWDEKHQ